MLLKDMKSRFYPLSISGSNNLCVFPEFCYSLLDVDRV